MIGKAKQSRKPLGSVKLPVARQTSTIGCRAMVTPLGTLWVSATDRGVCAIEFGRRKPRTRLQSNQVMGLKGSARALAPAMAQLREYFTGRRLRFDLPVDLSALTLFQRKVLAVIQKIPAGQTWTYGQVAIKMGRPNSARPVGQALARNPLPIIIPCHRVIANNGALRGYSGGSGLSTKRWLLRHEGAPW